MKRIVVLLLCLCMVLPMVFAMAFSAGATADAGNETPVISTDKSVYYPGEEIKVTASYTSAGCWIGIVPADENGDPIISKGTIYWETVPEEGLTDFSIKDGTAIGGNGAALAELMGGVTEDEMLALCTGKYFVVHIDSSKGIGTVDQSLVTYVPITITQFTMEKTSFHVGEEINVNVLYTSASSGYIGLSHVKDDGTVGQNLYYTYISSITDTNIIDISKGTLYGEDAEKYGRLPAGRYVVYFVPTNSGGAGSRDQRSEVYIDILGATVEKTEFHYGEPIMVTGYGAGTDWIGISQLDDSTESGYWSNGSIRWRYIANTHSDPTKTGYGSGEAFDIREAFATAAGAARADIPVGEYVIFVGLEDCYAKDVSPYTHITITVTAEAPAAPASVDYQLTDERTGLAGGKLTVTFNEADMELYKKPTKVELYWADESGNELGGYNRIGSRKVTGTTTEIEMTASMVIPAEAKKLMVRAYNGAGTAEAVAVDLPTDRGYRTTGEKVTSFQIVSDMHIGRGTESDTHANLMFDDIMAIDPDSVGIFVAGDAADHGQAAEYEQLFSLWDAANEKGLTAKLYIGVGNHEMMYSTESHNYSSDYNTQMGRFLEYANQSLEEAEQTTTPYYYVSRGGQHFIFLATEYCGTHAYLSNDQLNWLSDKLAEVASDGAPVFIMLHQPLYNTVAGGLANEDGSKRQGWHGVIAGDENFEAWKALVAENNKGTSDHSLMYGQYEAPLRDILKQYPSAMMFSGHSHWILESLGNIYEATETQPNYMFNTASVSYLWTDNDELNGGTGTAEGSQGYYVTVYENCIEFRGRDFLNGKWIPNAYYRIWLDCAHEGEAACDTVCKWCGEDNTNAVPHAGEVACDTVCKYGCGTPVESAGHEGATLCADICKHCNVAIEPVADHTGVADCATVCMYGCNTAVTPDPEAVHGGQHGCSETCAACGEAIEPAQSHAGAFDCSDKCATCNAEIEPRDEHINSAVLCSGLCTVCNEQIFIQAAHEGAEACSTVCKYGCGTAVSPTGAHAPDFDCSETCSVCLETVTPAKAHAGAFACSDVCATCGIAVTPAAHEGEYACSTVCKYGCETPVEGVAHESADVCGTVCKYGCGTAVEGTGEHVKTYKCSETCSKCGMEVAHAAHVGISECATVCKYGCGASVTPKVKNHKYDNACDTTCNECAAVRVLSSAHIYINSCDTTCENCDWERTAAEHVYSGACDATCNICGAERDAAAHSYGEWKTVREATTTATGLEKRACTYCGTSEENELPIKSEQDAPTTDAAPEDQTVTLPLVGEVDRNIFVIVIVVLVVVLVNVAALVSVSVSRKKKKKAEAAEEIPEEETEEKAEEATEESSEEKAEDATEESAEEKTEEAPADDASGEEKKEN